MAKKQRTNQATASFHYLVKRERGAPDSEEVGFSPAEFSRLVSRLRDTAPIDFNDESEVRKIKAGENIPLLTHTQLSEERHFGSFEGAYYGQEYRNTKVGTIDADSLNLRKFHYLIDYRRDGKIVLGVQYLGNYGDYDGIRLCLSRVLQGNDSVVVSKSFSSMQHEVGDGTPVEVKVTLRRSSAKIGGSSLFSRSGVFAIKKSDYGDSFGSDVKEGLVNKVRGSIQDRKSVIAGIMSQGDIMEVNDEDIEGCTILMRRDGHQYTIYLLGDRQISTKFPLNVYIPRNGILESGPVQSEMVRLLDDIVTPGLRK